MVGKLHVGSFFFSPPFCVNVFTGWTTHSFHLCRPRGSSRTMPPVPPPNSPLPNLPTPNFLSIPPSLRLNRLIRSAGVGCLRCGCWWGGAQTFSLESHFPVVSPPPPPAFFRCSFCRVGLGGWGGKGGKGFKYKHVWPQQ